MPDNFTVRPDTRSRFYDATNPDCPQLPVPRPILRGYDLPPLQSQATRIDQAPAVAAETVPAPPAPPNQPSESQPPASLPELIPASPQSPADESSVTPASSRRGWSTGDGSVPVITAAFDATAMDQEPQPANKDSAAEPLAASSKPAEPTPALTNKVTIPPSAWQVLPPTCLDRMLEFQSLRDEYTRTFSDAKLDSSVADKRPLNLANLMELATINSREYQLRKESCFVQRSR